MRNLVRRRARAFSAALVMVLSAAALPLDGQTRTWRGRELEQRWRSAAWRLGPLRLQPLLVISNAGVDSNIYYSPQNPVKDFTLTAGPALNAWLPLGRVLVASGYASPQYVWYSKTSRERTWNYYYSGSLALNLRRLFISGERRYSDARERWNTEIDIRPRRKEDGWAGVFLLQATHRVSLEFGWRYARYLYENLEYETFNIRERLNRKETRWNVLAYYQAGGRSRLFLDYERGEYDFEFAEASALKDSRSDAAYAGVEFPPLGRLRGRVRVGWKRLDVLNPEVADWEGLVGDTQVSLRLARPFVVRASYARDVDFSLWYQSAYFVQSRPSAGASLYFLRYVRLDYDYSLGRSDYPAPQDFGGGEVKRRDDFYIHQAGLYFRVWKKAALGAVVSRWRRDSNLDREDDTRYFYGLNLTYDF